LNSYVSPVQKGRILTDFADIIRPGEKAFTAHVSIYSQVNEIVNSNYSRKEIDKYFNRPGWAELETVVSETIATCPPLCFYLDAVDEEFGHAPMYWLRAQKGLFYQVMRFLRDAQLGSRLHIVIGMRDIVLASVYRSEHQTRYRGEPHIRVLSWDKKAIEYFLHEKLAKLDEHFFIGGLSTGRTLTNWLGMSEVTNVQRNVNEPIMQYLLRHTRLLPRDIVTLGNLLCRSISEMQAQPSRSDKQLLVRKTVSEAARVFGNEQLAICANELASAAMPAHAVDHGYAETYTANQEYIRGIAEDLKNVISYIGIDRFSFERLREAQKFAEDRFEEGTDPLSVLWMNGLLGYVDGGRGAERHVFYSDDRMDEFHLPLNRQEYILHPILIDSVGVGISEGKPIVPFDGE
jgi:hypothetical protein